MASRHGRQATVAGIVSGMFFDPEDPPVEPARGRSHGLLRRLFRAWRESRHSPPQSCGGLTAGVSHGVTALIRYAQVQVETADAILARHVEVGLGLCGCGRLHPCPERRQWIRKRAHYVPLLSGPR
ncbi:hypothetical protein GA0070606_1364 [Micromonospora citrea]|uniref:Uncharacterized protein n=1 Tax=Micromonospora citrea TaxID=47855 RepID=A0A1C6U4I9_9ACTN|nr:hypothetical protein GA0070606_1364 [Micromonospora citrea]